jgi:hypothetical protein
MDASVENAYKIRWLILIYHLPREPSRHRVAVWRKLKALGALYLQDGAAALPDNAVTREQLEWLQLRAREAGSGLARRCFSKSSQGSNAISGPSAGATMSGPRCGR